MLQMHQNVSCIQFTFRGYPNGCHVIILCVDMELVRTIDFMYNPFALTVTEHPEF